MSGAVEISEVMTSADLRPWVQRCGNGRAAARAYAIANELDRMEVGLYCTYVLGVFDQVRVVPAVRHHLEISDAEPANKVIYYGKDIRNPLFRPVLHSISFIRMDHFRINAFFFS